MAELIGIILALIVSWGVTGLMCLAGPRLAPMDIPNHRSCHMNPTPRGGGIGMVIGFVLVATLFSMTGVVSSRFSLSLISGSLLVAAIGFCDDVRDIPAIWRLTVHFIATAVFFYFSDVWSGFHGLVGLSVILVMMVGMVWLLNVFNFMDGIDGIAAMEGLSVTTGAGLILFLNKDRPDALLVLGVGAICLGFLLWNWPPARIFMGDVGSCFLGFVIGGIMLKTVVLEHSMGAYSWLILLAVFLTDATITLLTRIFKGEAWLQSHCSHAYQQASLFYSSHLKVTAGVLGINIFWLFPLAFFVEILPSYRILGTFIAYLPLIVVVFIFKSGKITPHKNRT
ncbi:MAG: glycosyltransferase family 4 protein [Proteobacteria bacterium]|nr:glycosyltransferase family 4 protein [Pseudomonadota bacterium]MBU1686560.1 glycosyltransferase family 4 protein [Pseudomonadota bacterium]